MKSTYWILLGVAVVGGGLIWYSRRGTTNPAPTPSQAKPTPQSVALAAASALLSKYA